MRCTALATLLFSGIALGDPTGEIDRLEALDARILESARLLDHSDLWTVTTRAALGAWTQPSTLEVRSLPDGTESFTLRFRDGTVRGFYPSSHCCTEVIFAGLETTSDQWSFFGSLHVGSSASEVLDLLGRDAKREGHAVTLCGAHDCIHFLTENERVVRIELVLYTG